MTSTADWYQFACDDVHAHRLNSTLHETRWSHDRRGAAHRFRLDVGSVGISIDRCVDGTEPQCVGSATEELPRLHSLRFQMCFGVQL